MSMEEEKITLVPAPRVGEEVAKNEPIYRSEYRALHIVILVFAIAVAVCGGILLYFNTLGATKPPEFITLGETNNVSFKAYLTDTTPFGRDYLDKTSDTIPMNILEHIDLTTDYKASLSYQTRVDFNDAATVTVVATQNKGTTGVENNPVILNRTFPLCFNNGDMTDPGVCPDGSGTATAKNIHGAEYIYQRTYRLYLQPYIDFVEATTESYVDYPIRSSITVEFQMAATNNDQLRSLMRRTVNIPLTDDNAKLEIIGDETQSKDFYVPVRSEVEVVLLIVFGALVVAGIGVAIWMIKKVANKKTPYRVEIDGYLNDYSDAIVKTVTPPDLKAHPEKIAVEAFKELLGLAVSISDPIMFFETHTLSMFYIARDKILYYFIIPNPRYYRGGRKVEAIEAAILLPPVKGKKKVRKSKKTAK